MRFTAATVAFFAGLAAAMPNGADTTVYQTEEVTIISCGPEVTNCPGRATSTIPSGAAATETSVMTTAVPTTPAGGAQPVSSGSAPSWSSSASAPAVTSATSATAATTVAPVVPVVTPSVIAHTSCSTWYETVTPSAGGAGSVPSGSSPVGSGSGSGVPHVPSSSKGSAPGSASASPSSTPVFNGAGAVSGSLTFAGAAAAAAFFLA
ncbi:hypothetical protein N7523_003840 [Penicillium sp. IBT 18751x]|nr:hypothetical protein N7523_003840 [Penicillium sp. IBT 18751x]